MEYREDDFLLLSGIQHFAFCRRQWALIYIEGVWDENGRTAEGRLLVLVKSLPARGAWIEIDLCCGSACASIVAPRTGSVD